MLRVGLSLPINLIRIQPGLYLETLEPDGI